jgi:two-component sensor histidine kinase
LFIFSISAQRIFLTEEEKLWIKNNPEVSFGYDPNWPPFEIYENGKYSGICADYMKIISTKTGIKFKPYPNLTWEQSFEKLKNNEIMMVPGAGITEDRKKFLIFTENYIHLPWVIVTKSNVNNYKHVKDLNNQLISIPKDYMQHEVLKRDFPNIKLLLRKNFSECVKDVSSGKSVATIGSLGAISYSINETGSKDVSISAYTHYSNDYVAFAFPKKQEMLRNIVQKALASIKINDRNKINEKWITIKIENNSTNKDFWKYISLILLIIGILFFIFYLWNKSLRKQINLRKVIENELFTTLDEVKKQNDDKTVLLQEIHHRVKNNLQIIISLLRLQANSQTNSEVQNALYEAVERINSISLVHEHIYKNPNLAEFDINKYIQNLGEELKRIFVKDKEIIIDVEIDLSIHLDLRPIVPLALILNELYSKSFKYAFRNKASGSIKINLFLEDNKLILNYSDNGEWFNNSYTKNFGTYLIEIFTEQLNGVYQLEKTEYTSYRFEFSDF